MSVSSSVRFPGESAECRSARDELLAAELDLRMQVERVAALRRKLPVGGAVREDYAFGEVTASGPSRVRLADHSADVAWMPSMREPVSATRPLEHDVVRRMVSAPVLDCVASASIRCETGAPGSSAPLTGYLDEAAFDALADASCSDVRLELEGGEIAVKLG